MEQNSDVPLVVVNGDTINSSYIEKLIIKSHKNLDMAEKRSFDYNNLIKKSVNDLLILQEAYGIGMHEEESLLNYLESQKKDQVRKLYLYHTFKPEIVIPEDEIKTYFEENLKRYQFRTIAVKSLDEANKIYDLLMQGLPFDSLALEHSLDHRKYKNGLHLVTFKKNLDRILLDKANEMQVGEIAKPFLYKNYFTIVRLEKRMEADPKKYEVFREKILEDLTKDRREIAWNDFMADLLKLYPVTIDTSIIDEIIADRDKVLKMDFRVGTERPVLLVDDNNFITDRELRNEISYAIMNAGTDPFNILLNRSLNIKREELLGTVAGLENGYWDSTRIINWYEQTLDSALIEIYLKEMIVSKITFNKKEFEEYYNLNIDKFKHPDEYLLKSLMVTDSVKAYEISSALQEGAQWSYIESNYNQFLDEYQFDEEWVVPDNFPEHISRHLKSSKKGQITNPFQTDKMWTIFKVLDIKQGTTKSIAEVDLEIRAIMFQRKFNNLLDEHLELLKGNSDIIYFDKAINEFFSAN